MKLSEQAKQDNHISMLEMELDNTTKRIMELEKRIDELDHEIFILKIIIKSLSGVL